MDRRILMPLSAVEQYSLKLQYLTSVNILMLVFKFNNLTKRQKVVGRLKLICQ
jgi:hypothetical protein